MVELIYAILFMHFWRSELLNCSCVSILRSVFSNGSSLFSSKHCVSFMLSRPFCLHLPSHRMAAFADLVDDVLSSDFKFKPKKQQF